MIAGSGERAGAGERAGSPDSGRGGSETGSQGSRSPTDLPHIYKVTVSNDVFSLLSRHAGLSFWKVST